MGTTIFVSYSHVDTSLVTPVVRLLRATDDLVFQDSDSIKPGKKWREEIGKGISGSDLFLVFWCGHSQTSKEVEKEYVLAIELDKDVLPILLDSTPLPQTLRDYQWIDFREVVGHMHEIMTGSSETPSGCLSFILELFVPKRSPEKAYNYEAGGLDQRMAAAIEDEIRRRIDENLENVNTPA